MSPLTTNGLALIKMTAVTSAVLRGGEPSRVPSAKLVCGDVLLLSEGDAVGADARLFRSSSLRALEASLTGESEAVFKDESPLSAPVALGDRANMVFKGTAVGQGAGSAIVIATGMATQMGHIAHLLDATVAQPTPLQLEVVRVGRLLGLGVMVIASVVVGTVLLMSDIRGVSDVIPVLLLGVSLAVAAVPEGLPAILSLVFALGVQRMARHRAIVKKLSSVETLGSATVIASDKTGTLTRAEMTIERVITVSGSTRITGVGYAPEGRVEHEGAELPPGALRAEQIVTLSGGSLAGNAERRKRRFERIGEVPFTSQRKLMSTLEMDHEHGGRVVLVTKGAPGVLLERQGLEIDAALRARLLTEVDTLADAALRTSAVAYRLIGEGEGRTAGEALEHDLIFVGIMGMLDPPRKEAAKAMSEAMDDARFAEEVRVTSVFARVAPAHKLRIVAALLIRPQEVSTRSVFDSGVLEETLNPLG